MAIPITKPSIKRKDMDAVLTCLVSDSLGPGVVLKEFLSQISGYLKRSHAVAVREYPRAMRLVRDALELPPGARIVLSALTPAFFVDMFHDLGLTPLFADTGQNAPVISASSVRERYGDEFDAVFSPTTLGYVPDLASLSELGVPLIEEISEGLGSHTGDGMAGTYGQFTLLSLEPEGIITAGGGVVVLAGGKKERTALKHAADGLPQELILPDMNAALASTQMKEVERFVRRREEIANVLVRAVQQSRHKMPFQEGDGQNVYCSLPVLLETGLREVFTYARKKNVETKLAFDESVLARYAEEQGTETADEMKDGSAGKEERNKTPEIKLVAEEYPNARSFLMRCVLFPLFPTMSRSEVEQVERVLSTLP